MQTYQNLSLHKDKHGIVWMTLDVINKPANILNPDVLDEIMLACSEIRSLDARGVILRSGKKSGFIAGADIEHFKSSHDTESNLEKALTFIHQGQKACEDIENLPIPTVAMIDGFCMGGGTEISLACTYIVASDTSSTRIALPEIKLGIHPGFGGTVRSIRRMGAMQAMPFMLTGRAMDGRRAARSGLVDYCVPIRQLKNTAVQTILQQPAKKTIPWHKRLLEKKPLRSLVAMQMRKQVKQKANPKHYPAPYALIDLWDNHGDNEVEMYRQEALSVSRLILTETAQNLVRVFFLQTRLKGLGDKALFKPRRVHVIGGGVMGGDIAGWCAMQGQIVTVQDMNEEAIARVIQRASKNIGKRYHRDRKSIRDALDRLVPDIQGHGIARADVIIEAIYENLEAKQKLFQDVETKARPDAILATNTSSIELHKIASALQYPERLIGLHFFNPVFKMPLLEVVYDEKSFSEEQLDLALSFARHINKLPLPVKSSPGFLINRILMPYLLEGVKLYQQGVPASVIDRAATDFGMPMGPLELADTVGLDICLHVGRILADTVGVELPDELDRFVKDKNLGKKTGKGFYEYKNGKRVKPNKVNWDGDSQQLQKKLIGKMLDEAQKCLDEGIVEDGDLLDAGVIFGTGFAPFRGGPMHYQKTL